MENRQLQKEIIRTEVPGGFIDSAYIDGKRHGEEIEFSRDKKRLVRITIYKNGKREGLQIEYSDTGGIETPFENDKINGIVKWYDHASRLLREDPFTDGVRNGTVKDYAVRGTKTVLVTETVYKNGVKEGVQKEYAEDGITIKKQTLFANDKAVKA